MPSPQITHTKIVNRDDEPDRVKALCQYLDPHSTPAEVEQIPGDLYGEGVVFKSGGREYAVLTDSEADRAVDESLDSYIDDCVLPELPESLRFYFDSELFKRDAILSDGRGHCLSTYDGNEGEAGEFYVYRIN